MFGRSLLLAMLGVAVAIACDSKKGADDDDEGARAGEGGEGATSTSGAGGKGGGAGGASGGTKGGSAGSNASGGSGTGESGAPSSGGSGGSGGDAGEGATGGGDAGTGGTTGGADHGGSGGASAGSGGASSGGTAGSGVAGSGGTAGSGGAGSGGTAGKGGAAGAGATSGAGGAAGGAAGAGGCGDLIDDMEAGTGFICQGNGRTGSWFSYASTYSTFSPPGYPVPTTLLSPARGTSTRAMRAYGTKDEYAGFGFWLATTPATFDASAYTGVRFYAKGNIPYVKVIFQTSATESTMYGGTCELPALQCAGNEVLVPLAATWSLLQVPFSSGAGGTVPIDESDLWSIEFQPPSAGAFDFYVDDVAFY